LLEGLEKQKAERAALAQLQAQGQRVFIPAWKYPATWLHQGCWEDEVGLLDEIADAANTTHASSGINLNQNSKGSHSSYPANMAKPYTFPINTDFNQIDYHAHEVTQHQQEPVSDTTQSNSSYEIKQPPRANYRRDTTCLTHTNSLNVCSSYLLTTVMPSFSLGI
jgi:hypothetical protein